MNRQGEVLWEPERGGDCAEVYRKELVRTTLAPDEVNDEAYYNRAWNLEAEGQFTRL